MKQRLTKKLLSLLLSVLMIISSMPFAVVTASAADNDNAEITVMHYTFDNTLADSNGNNGLTIQGWANSRVSGDGWEYTNGAFRHGDGGCFGTISGLSGLKQWKLTYQGYSAVDIDESKKDKSCEIGLGTTETTTDAIRISNYGQIFINGVPKNDRGSLLSSTTNTIVIAYDNGSLSVSINGNTTNYDGDDGVESTIFENIVSMHSGVNSKTDGDSVGRVGSYDHYIYDIVATTYVDSYTLLTEKMQEFENKLQTGKIYTNISNAYTAYVEASKAYDSYYYGGDTSIQLATYAENLNEAVNSMEEWTFARKYANNNKGIWMKNNDSNPMPFQDSYTPSSTSTGLGESHTYYTHQNILYAGIANKDFASLLNVSSMNGWLRYQPITMMYDGGDTLPQAPIMVVYGSSAKAPRFTLAITLSDNDNNSLKLVNRWLFSRDSSYAENFDWSNAYLQNGNGDNCISQSLPGWQVRLGYEGGFWGAGAWTTTPGMANLYYFDGSFSNNEYLKTIIPTINFYTNDSEGSTNITISQKFTASGDTSNPVTDYRIHVINYKAVIDAADVYKKNANVKFDVTKYREGGLKTHIDKINDVGNSLNFNPNEYFSSATSSSNAGKNDYQGCANKISEICTSVNNVNNSLKSEDDPDQYPALRKAMDETMATYKAGMGNYTYRSYNQFKTKYEFAQTVMQNVITWGYVDGSFAETAAADLTTAYNNLETQKSNITFDNLFSFEDFYNSKSAEKGSLTSASFDRANKTMTLVGTNDVSTVHGGENLYMIPVEPGKTYRLELDVEASDNYSLHNCDVMAFLPNEEGTSYDTNYVNYVNWRGYTSSTWRNYNTHKSIEFTIPADYPIERSKIFFRFGTMHENDDDVQQVTATYKNIEFYDVEREAERVNIDELGISEISVTPNKAYGTLPAPERDGYHFLGWFTSDGTQVTAETVPTVAGTINLQSKWEEHNYVTTISKTGNTYTWTKTCSGCDDSAQLGSVDASAYVSAVAAAQTDIANTVKYSSASIANLQNVLDNNNLTFANEHVLTQDEVNTATNNIILADQLKTVNNNGVLELATYTVTFNTVNGENPTEEKVSENKYEYGSVVSLKAKDVHPYKWMIGDQKVATATDEFSLVVTGDVIVNAHYLSQTASVTEQHLVTVYNRQGKIVGYLYVDDGKTLSVIADGISDGKTTVKPEKLPFYQITGYTVEGGADANGYTVTSDIKVYANYSAQPTIEITLASSTPAIYFSNDSTKSETTKTVVWDQKVTVKADEEVIWLVDGKAVAKGTSYTFRASASIEISVKAVENETPLSVITYAEFDTDNKKARLAVSNYSSENYVIEEQGIIFGTTTNMDAELKVEELSRMGKKYVATKTTDTGDQFSYTLAFTSATKKKLCVISYVTYKNGKTIYSEDVTYITIN